MPNFHEMWQQITCRRFIWLTYNMPRGELILVYHFFFSKGGLFRTFVPVKSHVFTW